MLIVFTVLIDYFAKKNSLVSKKYLPAPTSFPSQSFSGVTPVPKPFPTGIKTLPFQTTAKMQQLKSKLPIDTENFKIDYSYVLDTFVIVKKTPQADAKLKEFFDKNQISYAELLKKNLLVFTEKPLNEFKNQLENDYLKIREEKKVFSPSPSLSLSSSSSTSLNLLTEFLNIFLNYNYQSSDVSTSTPTLPGISPTLTQNKTSISPLNSPSNLNDIFNEVGQKVGVPPKILEAVMTIEMPSTFNLSSQQIADYSSPGNYWPACGPNICSAAGPMQMTIGIDDNGDTSCPVCGAGFCPNAWASYGEAVNSYGGYPHQANPCNIRDNVYGSAAKLRNDSQATTSSDWTQEQVYRAATRYYGSCDDKYSYERLGNRTYCQFVWDYYQGK